ncbi:hypothetical protein HDU98_005867, partial [Podochytrium sp. JEL0797]
MTSPTQPSDSHATLATPAVDETTLLDLACFGITPMTHADSACTLLDDDHTASSPLPLLNKTLPPPVSIPDLPNELLLLVCLRSTTSTLLLLRLASTRLRALANLVLRDRTRKVLVDTEAVLLRMSGELELLEVEKRPHLRHYKQFLRNISMNDLTEAIWYTSPPEELKTVCECLCILKGQDPISTPTTSPRRINTTSSTSSSDSTSEITGTLTALHLFPTPTPPPTTSTGPAADEPTTWHTLKKQMSRYDFKNWVANLRTNVDKIPYASIKRVEHIIMHDQSITYERLRE